MTTKAGREAWALMHELMFSGRSRDHVRSVCREVGLRPGQMKALLHLSAEHPRPMRELAGEWDCDASYITVLVDQFEEAGLAMRRPHPTDRRIKTVVLTGSGVAMQKRLWELLSEPPESLGTLTAAEQRQLRDLLRKIAGADQAPTTRPAPREATA